MDIEFNNLDELYSRLKPALYSKKMELKRNNISYVTEVDIWNYLTLTKWKKSKSLLLSDMVEDIMALKNEDIKSYLHELIKNQDRDLMRVED